MLENGEPRDVRERDERNEKRGKKQLGKWEKREKVGNSERMSCGKGEERASLS